MRIAIALAVMAFSGVATAGGGGGYGGGIGGRPHVPTPHICCESVPDKTIDTRVRRYVPITIVEVYPKAVAKDVRWDIERLRRSCFERFADAPPVQGRLSIEFAFGFDGQPVQVRVWGLDEAANRCVADAVEGWRFNRYALGWDAAVVRAVAWVGYNDLPRYRTLRAWKLGRECAE